MLESLLAFDTTGRVCGFIRERRGTPTPINSSGDDPVCVLHASTTVSRMHRWPGEYILIEMWSGCLRLTAGPFGTVPLYLTTYRDIVAGSWHLPDLRRYVSIDRLCDRAVMRALTRKHRYSSDTVLTGVHRLTERATATFTAGGCTLDYPCPSEHVLRARRPRPGVDLVAAFGDLLTSIISETPVPVGQVGVELSGGADSANVALTVTGLRDDLVRSYGLVVDGDVGAQQRRRRKALAGRLGLTDTELRASEHPPFAPSGVRARLVPHDPTAAYYREAFDALRDAAAASLTRVVFTGLGGDEITALHPHEPSASPPDKPASAEISTPTWLGPAAKAALPEVDHNLAPVSPVPVPSLLAFGLHNPAYLRAGIWPVAPLAYPLIGRFCEQLPAEWRRGKALFRVRLRRAGFSEEVIDPPWPEHFSDLMQTGLRRHGLTVLQDMLRESILVDCGYLDRDGLRAAYEHARTAEHIPSQLCDPIALETGLRSLR